MTPNTFARVEAAVGRFLIDRGIEDFIVRATTLDETPVVLILADAQRRLRYSNVLESMIRRWIAAQMSDYPQAHSLLVFWRYRLESDPRTLDGPIAEHGEMFGEALTRSKGRLRGKGIA